MPELTTEQKELLESYFEFECQMFRHSTMLHGVMGSRSGLSQPIYDDLTKHQQTIFKICGITRQQYKEMFTYPDDVKEIFEI